ncbi:stage II sporulation protein M [Asticcacaulis solisilvae]|uniref:stage II sporulation protein M n=1 Tax=Asticcacaulis solisilvae TaxID=1217274 RepID=UPI003FD7C114
MAEPEIETRKPVLQLKSQKFRDARQGDWKALNAALDKVDSKGLGQFSIDEILNLPVLYRSAMSSLSMAQSISLDRNMITYLQALCARAYVYIYGPHTRFKDVLSSFFLRAWPQSIRKLAAELWLAFFVTVLGVVIGWLLCAHDSSWYHVFISPMEAQGRDVGASVKDLRDTLGGADKDQALSPFAVFLMTHNTQVSIMAFAVGALFGLPTLLVLMQNGITMGAMLWLFSSKGLGVDFAAWLTIHGTTEMSAIIIAGACGFHIGRRLMFPGDRSRKAALTEAGRLTGTVMIGVALMLTVAGCLEGIGRQTITLTAARIAIGVVMLILWWTYFTFVGRKAEAGNG